MEQRRTNSDLKSKIEILERFDSNRNQEVEIDLASALHSTGIELSDTVSDGETILDITSPLPKSTLHDTDTTTV